VAVASRLVGPRSAFRQKPFTPELLTLSVRELLDRRTDEDPAAADAPTTG
jgi:hypothetical protein